MSELKILDQFRELDFWKLNFQNINSYYISKFNTKDERFGLFFTNNNEVFVSGDNSYGQLGIGHAQPIKGYEKCDFKTGKIVEVFQGMRCMFAMNDKNELYFWGSKIWEDIAQNSELVKWYKPEKLTMEKSGEKIKMISTGNFHNLFLTETGRVFALGDNNVGQCGDFNEKVLYVPKEIKFNILEEKDKICNIHTYSSTSFAITITKKVIMWGEDGWSVINDPINENVLPTIIWDQDPHLKIGKLICTDNSIFILTDKNNLMRFNQSGFKNKFNEFPAENIKDILFFDHILLIQHDRIEDQSVIETVIYSIVECYDDDGYLASYEVSKRYIQNIQEYLLKEYKFRLCLKLIKFDPKFALNLYKSDIKKYTKVFKEEFSYTFLYIKEIFNETLREYSILYFSLKDFKTSLEKIKQSIGNNDILKFRNQLKNFSSEVHHIEYEFKHLTKEEHKHFDKPFDSTKLKDKESIISNKMSKFHLGELSPDLFLNLYEEIIKGIDNWLKDEDSFSDLDKKFIQKESQESSERTHQWMTSS